MTMKSVSVDRTVQPFSTQLTGHYIILIYHGKTYHQAIGGMIQTVTDLTVLTDSNCAYCARLCIIGKASL